MPTLISKVKAKTTKSKPPNTIFNERLVNTDRMGFSVLLQQLFDTNCDKITLSDDSDICSVSNHYFEDEFWFQSKSKRTHTLKKFFDYFLPKFLCSEASNNS
jgi:hypothetical protein